jgi:hypothetical protein
VGVRRAPDAAPAVLRLRGQRHHLGGLRSPRHSSAVVWASKNGPIWSSDREESGPSWEASWPVAWGLSPHWCPVVHAHEGRLFLFYAESTRVLAPGGDLKLITSTDGGATPQGCRRDAVGME